MLVRMQGGAAHSPEQVDARPTASIGSVKCASMGGKGEIELASL